MQAPGGAGSWGKKFVDRPGRTCDSASMAPVNIALGFSNVLCALLAIGFSLPLLRRKIGMNASWGVRFQRAFDSEELWYRINEYGARRLIFWSVPILLAGVASFFVDFDGRELLVLPFAMAPVLLVVAAMETRRFAKGI